jgi:glyoxylase-like metal-dependent hydrolase (beta-lactamase superfamily II)
MMSCRSLSLLAAALAVIGAGPSAARPAPVAAAAQPFMVGSLHLWALRDALNVVPNDASVFGTDAGAPAVAAVLRKAGAPTDTVTLGVDALLARMPGRVVLIDTGLGDKAGGMLVASLADAGVKPADVTDILVTHSHGDHVGGLIGADGKPVFPKAMIRMSSAEWTFLRGQSGMKALVAAISPSVRPFAPGTEVVPGITAVAIPGHTPGHVGYEIVSGKDRLIDIGDTAHSAIVSSAEPGWSIGYDTDAAQGKASRTAMLARLAVSHERVFAPHFPFPGTGRIVRAGAGYAWAPALR